MKSILLILLSLSFVSCASYLKRKDCAATNWYDYGYKVAMDGRRLSGDQFISECYQADGDVGESALDTGFKSGMEMYCQPETVFQTGKSGKFFSTEMCTGQGLTNLQNKYHAGVLEYCQKSNGYSAGAKGVAYNKICPGDLEVAFLPEFNRGRKRFLSATVSENEKQISQIDQDISRMQTDVRLKQIELQRYQYVKQNERLQLTSELSSQVRQLQVSISAKQSEQARLRNKNREIQLEIVQLDN